MSSIIIDVDMLTDYSNEKNSQIKEIPDHNVVTIISEDLPFMRKDEYLDRYSLYEWKDSFQLKKELDREIFKQELRCMVAIMSHLSNKNHFNRSYYMYQHGFSIILGDEECPIYYQNHQLNLTLLKE